MADWKEKLGNHPSYSGGGQMKKCACGREITRPGTDICGVCYSKQKQGSNTASTQHTYSGGSSTTATLPKGYLDGGYFETKNGKPYSPGRQRRGSRPHYSHNQPPLNQT